MNWNKKQREDFEKACGVVVAWLNENGNPHMTVLIEQDHAELLEGSLVQKYELID